MYIRLSSLRQTRFGYADSAFCLSFSLPIFLFIYNMLNNLKSVTFFLKNFSKKFLSFFCMPAGRYAAGRGSHSPAIFSGIAGIWRMMPRAMLAANSMRIIYPAFQPVTFNMPNNPKSVTLFYKKKSKKTAPHFRRAVIFHYLKITLVLYVTPVTIFWNLSIKI